MRFGLLRLVLAAPALACLAQAAAAAPPVAITNRLTLDYDVQADGGYTATLHIERRAGTDAAARSLAVFPWQYSPSHGESDILAAYTQKADGSKIPVGPTAIRDPVPDPSLPLALFTDRREKRVQFAGVVAGDSVVIDIRDRIVHPVLPGVFSLALMFDPLQAWDDVRVNVIAPGSVKLLADAAGLEAGAVGDGALVSYSWHYRNTEALQDAQGLLAPVERMPHLLVTSATDWQQIGRTYAAIIAPRAAVTALVRKIADGATTGLTDHRAIAQGLYDWVRGHIGYLAVPLGDSSPAPHTADEVLTNRIGDSQDHAVLLSALLSAKGIASEPALIDLEPVYRLSIPVPFAQLNHVLLYLPEFSVYADTTVGTARFGELPFADFGKPVVRAVASGDVVSSIPVLPPGAVSTQTTTAHLTAEDMIAGDTKTEGTGPFLVALRLAARRFAAIGMEAAGAAQLGLLGERGTGQFDQQPSEVGGAGDAVSGHFAVSVWPHLSADHRLSVPDGLIVLPRPGDLLIGPLDMATLPASEATPCFSGRQVEIVTLDVGPKYRVTQLPADRKIAEDAFTYGSHWSLDGQTVTVRREFEARVTQALCTGKLRTEAADLLREIRRDYAERVGLASN